MQFTSLFFPLTTNPPKQRPNSKQMLGNCAGNAILPRIKVLYDRMAKIE